MDNFIKALVKKHYETAVSLRRYFHKYPEVSGQEFHTQQKIMEELESFGVKPYKVANTGVVADIAGNQPGKIVAIRADIDALKLQDECAASYRSVHQGVCHACGHDGHMAMLLGIARMLIDFKQYCGTVRLLFQPMEEKAPSGAEMLIKAGVLANVDAIIGAHLWQELHVGTMGITYGRMMASPDEFVITIYGQGGHGAMPHQTRDPLLAGSQIVLALNTITSRNIDPLEPVALSVGVFHAGEVFNVIPDTATIKGTVRTFDPKVRQSIFARIEKITKGICEASATEYRLEKVLGCPPVVNDPDIVKQGVLAGTETLGSENVLEIQPVMGGEDFSCYLERIPGAFFFVGSGNPKKGISYPQHHPKFDIDEQALANGMEIMLRTVLKLLA